MTDLKAVADEIETLIERELKNLARQPILSSTDIRSLEILSKTLTQCLERRKAIVPDNPLQEASDEDLESDL